MLIEFILKYLFSQKPNSKIPFLNEGKIKDDENVTEFSA